MRRSLFPRRTAAPIVPVTRLSLSHRVLQVLLSVCAAACFYGCGVQGTVRPPRLEQPARITNLTVTQVGQTLQLNFTVPQLAADGERLMKPQEVEVLRAAAPTGIGLAKLPAPEVWVRLSTDQWQPYAQNNSVSYPAKLTAQEFSDWRGRTMVLGVRTLTRGFRRRAIESDASNLVDVPVIDVSEPPQDVSFEVTAKAVNVRFAPPSRTLGGEPVRGLTGYRVYRSLTGAAGPYELRGETAAPPFQDQGFQFGRTYHYLVRAVFGTPGHMALSAPSPPAQVTPRDVFPPAPPQQLSAIYTTGAVELVWTANAEPDLAGYNVYRTEDHSVQRLNKELVPTPIYRDNAVTAGKTYTYYVTAVDLSGNESKPSNQEEVEAQ